MQKGRPHMVPDKETKESYHGRLQGITPRKRKIR